MTPTPESLPTRTLLPQLVITATNDLQCINIAQGHYFRSGGRGTKKRKEPPLWAKCSVQAIDKKLHLQQTNLIHARSDTFSLKQDMKAQKTHFLTDHTNYWSKSSVFNHLSFVEASQAYFLR